MYIRELRSDRCSNPYASTLPQSTQAVAVMIKHAPELPGGGPHREVAGFLKLHPRWTFQCQRQEVEGYYFAALQQLSQLLACPVSPVSSLVSHLDKPSIRGAYEILVASVGFLGVQLGPLGVS